MEEPEVVMPEVLPAHHELGPSKYSSLFECPCYEGKKDGSPDAVRGTYSHLVVQANITGDMSLLEKNKKPDLVQQDDIATGEWGAGEIKALAGSHEIHSEDKIMFNPQLDNDLPVMKGVFGTVDAWFEDDNGFLHICDYKTFDRGGRAFLCEADFIGDGEFDIDWNTLTGTCRDMRKDTGIRIQKALRIPWNMTNVVFP